MHAKEYKFAPQRAVDTTAYKVITTWEELGNLLHFKNNHMSYARKFRNDLQKKIKIGKRTVYASQSPLSYIQRRLTPLFNAVMSDLPDNNVAIAYRKGVDVRQVLSGCAGSTIMVKCDIKKYYDNISFAHIVNTLMDAGFAPRGARLIAGYCCVYNGHFTSLQQGSACSPALANIVGHKYFDMPILAWLRENCKVPYKYYRYSDNLVLFCETEPGAEFVEAYKAAVKAIAKAGRFRTHSWSSIRNNHPKRHQEFLGVVLNKTATIERSKRDWLKAVLINTIFGEWEVQAKHFFEKTGELAKSMPDAAKIRKMLMALRGYCAYTNSVNPTFGKQLTKLYTLLQYMFDEAIVPEHTPEFMAEVKKYKLVDESVDAYVARCKAAITPY